MKNLITHVLMLLLLAFIITNSSFSQTVTTIAGNGYAGFVDGNSGTAEFDGTWAIAMDDTGNVFIADGANNRIRKIDHITGLVSTYAGTGTASSIDGPRLSATINGPIAITIDNNGNIIFGEASGNRVRKITPSGNVVTIAGSSVGFVDGQGTAAKFYNPRGLCTDSIGNIYVADRYNHAIRKIDTYGNVTTIAGNGSSGSTNGLGSSAKFNNPHDLCIDKYGNLYVADANNNKIRKILPNGQVSTFAGSGTAGLINGPSLTSRFDAPMVIDVTKDGIFYIGEGYNNTIRKISNTGAVTTYAGTGISGYLDGNLTSAMFNNPGALDINSDENSMVIGDVFNYRIRKIDDNFGCQAPLPVVSNMTVNSGQSAALTASNGTNYTWYNLPSGGTILATTATYNTPFLTQNDTFYVSNTTTCESPRVPVIVYVTTCSTPPPSVTGASRCGTGSLTLHASGGANYLWYNAANGGNIINMSAVYNTPTLTNTFTYYVTNFDSCESARVPVVASINNLNINAGTDKTISCGSSTPFNTSTTYNGGGTLTYAWSPLTGLSSGSIANPTVQLSQTTEYTVMVTDSICTSFDIIMVNVTPATFGVAFSSNVQLVYVPPFAIQFNNLTPGLANYSFTWHFGDGFTLLSNNPTVFHQYAQNGLYDVTLEATNTATGCIETNYQNGYIFCAGGNNCTHTSTINQSSPVSSCVGTPVTLTCNTVTGGIYQWNYNGVAISNTNNTVFSATASGNYSVTIIVSGCPVTSNIVIVNQNDVPQTPVITEAGSLSYCGGGSVTLTAPAGFSAYLWSNGDSGQNTTVTQSGNYSVQVTDNNGCSAQSLPLLVGASPLSNPDICMVSVDSTTGNNVIVWNKTVTTAINHYNIYGEGTQANVFNLLGTVPYSSLSVFMDTSSHPMQQAYRYKISAVDTCGAETDLSAYHKSIHLTINQGMGSSFNLIWNYYEGITFPSYNIYRGTSLTNITLLTTIASTLNSYTDLNPPAGYVYYQIEAVNPNPCNPAKSSYNSTLSNIATNNPGPITHTSSLLGYQDNIMIYPNPASDKLNIDFNQTFNLNENPIIEVYNVQNQLIIQQKVDDVKIEINIEKFVAGVYFIKLSSSDRIVFKKFVKE